MISNVNKKDISGGYDFRNPAGEQAPSALGSKFDGWDEAAIWKAYKSGSREAFVYIYHKYFPVLYNYGHQLCSRSEQIEDCIQELFVDLSRAGQKLGDTDSIKFYLIKSLKNKFLKILKKEKRVKENEKFFPGYDFQFTLSAEQKIINAQLDKERIAKLNKSLDLLTARQREAIYYYFYEGLSIDEISEIMEVTNRRTVQNIIYRALAYLRKNISLPLCFLAFI